MSLKSIPVQRYVIQYFLQNTTGCLSSTASVVYKILSSQFLNNEIVFISPLQKYGRISNLVKSEQTKKEEQLYNVVILDLNDRIGHNKDDKSKKKTFKHMELFRIEELSKNSVLIFLKTVTIDSPFGKMLRQNVLNDLKVTEELISHKKLKEFVIENNSVEVNNNLQNQPTTCLNIANEEEVKTNLKKKKTINNNMDLKKFLKKNTTGSMVNQKNINENVFLHDGNRSCKDKSDVFMDNVEYTRIKKVKK
ncbi:hypothetical protein EDEG_00070 [Edhazardia aedis USNM 41457]|uniref:DUF5097 domain-containing protein n=1 Tax=Edhazardia aedis (strain USNM 41457) TaxID=1003232 RepID=J8ZZ35_EDHAE|nr:hypothetical protein EDEG_00070 [Edhazardia aedis USNM 41457]|eukprot:EJW04953.1 hypothetical protein EDEG_00070 [Edhazardia aedis USNM 41457]